MSRMARTNAKTHFSLDDRHALCGSHVDPSLVNPRGKNPIVKRFVAQPSCKDCDRTMRARGIKSS
jgi:hypothetical protein